MTKTHPENAFDLLRLLLALSVILSHSRLIGGYGNFDFLSSITKGQTNFADFGILGFFGLSGYLITSSFNNSKSIYSFISHRIIRIFPAYWVCLIITAFCIAPAISIIEGFSLNEFNFFKEQGSTYYIFNNFFLKINQWSINNLLDGAYYNGSLNGSLWSLFPELLCYILVVFLGVTGIFKNNKWLLLMIAAYLLIIYALNDIFEIKYGPTILILTPNLKLFCAFICGSIIYTYREILFNDIKSKIAFCILSILLLKFGGFDIIAPFSITFCLIAAFSLFSFKLKYDISYGMYIYSFPVQQLVSAYYKQTISFIPFTIICVSLTAILAIISCILIEQPASTLRKKLDLYL